MKDREFQQLVFDHIKADEIAFLKVSEELRAIRENHLHHIEKDISSVKTDLAWIKRLWWIVAAAIIGLLVKKYLL